MPCEDEWTRSWRRTAISGWIRAASTSFFSSVGGERVGRGECACFWFCKQFRLEIWMRVTMIWGWLKNTSFMLGFVWERFAYIFGSWGIPIWLPRLSETSGSLKMFDVSLNIQNLMQETFNALKHWLILVSIVEARRRWSRSEWLNH